MTVQVITVWEAMFRDSELVPDRLVTFVPHFKASE